MPVSLQTLKPVADRANPKIGIGAMAFSPDSYFLATRNGQWPRSQAAPSRALWLLRSVPRHKGRVRLLGRCASAPLPAAALLFGAEQGAGAATAPGLFHAGRRLTFLRAVKSASRALVGSEPGEGRGGGSSSS